MGYKITKVFVDRNWQEPHKFTADLVLVFVDIYKDTNKHWDAYSYALCE